jgi:hypothetical protein
MWAIILLSELSPPLGLNVPSNILDLSSFEFPSSGPFQELA